MAEPGVTTPYSTVAPYFGAPPGYVRTGDEERLNSYLTYEQIYWNNDQAYKVVGRGDDITPIYVPNGRTLVDTTNRYTAPNFGFQVTPGTDPALFGSPEQQAIATQMFTALFRREKFKSRFAMNKRYGLIRGDWLWHVLGDPLKPQGSRISIIATDPGSWFPVYDDEDLDLLVKVHLVDVFFNEAGEQRLKRLTYQRDPDTQLIIMDEAVYEFDGWWKDDAEAESVITPPTALPAEITSFPVYQMPNIQEPANPYGSSELRGLERVIQAVSQSVSDEDLALALEGLGVYATDGAGPVDEDGNETEWNLGPGEVIENAVGLKRVNGIGSLQPYGDHIGRLLQFLKEASATPDVAIGRVDVTVAESGIALALNLAPMLAKTDEKDQIILDVHANMFYDLKWWFKVYEQVDFTPCEILPTIGRKIPINIDKEIANAVLMVTEGLWSLQTAREELAKKGIYFAPDEDVRVTADKTAAAAAATSALDARMAAELAAGGTGLNAGG